MKIDEYLDKFAGVSAENLLEMGCDLPTTHIFLKHINKAIRKVPYYPKTDRTFYDLATLWADTVAFDMSISAMHYLVPDNHDFNKIAGVESGGWIYASELARQLSLPFLAIRRYSDLQADDAPREPGTTMLSDSLISEGDNILLVVDLIATGFTTRVSIEHIEKLGGKIYGIIALADIKSSGGKQCLIDCGYDVKTILTY